MAHNFMTARTLRASLPLRLLFFYAITLSSLGYASDEAGKINWKLLFNQLFALEIKKELPAAHNPQAAKEIEERYQQLLLKHIIYNPKSFDQAEKEILASASNSQQAFLLKKKMWNDPKNFTDFQTLDFKKSIAPEILKLPHIQHYLGEIVKNQERKIKTDENFFQSPESANSAWALSYEGREQKARPVTFVVIPGYASHALKFYVFEDIVKAANLEHQRPITRPVIKDEGILFEPESSEKFYQQGLQSGGSVGKMLDVLHPMGFDELGNTIGPNKLNAEHTYQWLTHLPDEYKDSKFILLGYSKAAPIILEMLARYPELQKQVIGVVTYAGVLQGTGMARQMLEQILKLAKKRDLDEVIKILVSGDSNKISDLVDCIMGKNSVFPAYQVGSIVELMKSLSHYLHAEEGVDMETLQSQVKKILSEPHFVQEAIIGTKDISPIERTKWNLLHLNDQVFDQPLFMFNLSALTDVSQFAYPDGMLKGARLQTPPIVPALVPQKESLEDRRYTRPDVKWKDFSLDAVFLYLSSLEGFNQAPAGLFDTQVELGHTKSFLIDGRPLSASLTPDELERLWSDPEVQGYLKVHRPNITQDEFFNGPRKDLIPSSQRKNFDCMDLGEIPGHHWSCMKQALFLPPSLAAEHADWGFPRMAYMRALLQIMGFYNLYKKESREESL